MSVFTKKFLRLNTDSQGSTLISADAIAPFYTEFEDKTYVYGVVGYNNWRIRLQSNSPSKANGKSTSVVSNKLVDSSATFITDGVSVGDIVVNLYQGNFATVVSVDSETEITLSVNRFSATDEFYNIYTPSYELEKSMADNVKKAISSKWRNAVLDFEVPEGVLVTYISQY